MTLVICGVGALGSHTAMLCRNLGVPMAFVDHDRVEAKNLRSQAYVKASIGKNKAEALVLQIRTFYGVEATAFPARLETTNVAAVCGGATVIADCFDNAASRRTLSQFASEAGIPLVHGALSADGELGIVRWDKRFIADEEDVAGQATCGDADHLPLVGSVAARLAASIQRFTADGVQLDHLVTPTETRLTFES